MFIRLMTRFWIQVGLVSALIFGTLTGGAAAAHAQGFDDPARMAKTNYIDRTRNQVSADAVPSMQANGPVNAVATNAKYAFVGGNFSQVLDPNGQWRGGFSRFAVMDIESGYWVNYLMAFNNQVNALAISPDGQRLYAVGLFTRVRDSSGEWYDREGIAEISITGGINQWGLTGFRGEGYRSIEWGSAGGEGVTSVAASNDYIFIAGGFLYVDETRRNNVAAFARNGNLIGFHPSFSNTDYERVNTVAVSPKGDRVFIGGSFSGLNGYSVKGLAQFMVGSWNLADMEITRINTATRASAGVTAISTDADSVYVSYFLYLDSLDRRWGNTEGTAANYIYVPTYKWMGDCHGDTTSNATMNGQVFTSGHNYDCSNSGGMPFSPKYTNWNDYEQVGISSFSARVSPRKVDRNTYKPWTYSNFEGRPAPYSIQWAPELTGNDGANNNVRAMSGNGRYLIAVGVMNRVNGRDVSGIVRFATSEVNTAKNQGPSRINPDFRVTADSSSNKVTFNWRSVFDRDDYSLRYMIYRDGVLAHQEVSPGIPYPYAQDWQAPVMFWTDYSASPGSAHEYRLVISDLDGNRMDGGSQRVVVGFNTPGFDRYSQTVAADGPDHFWPLNDAATGPLASDFGSESPMKKGGGVSGASGITGTQNSAIRLNGTADAYLYMPHREIGALEYSIELWVKPEGPGKLLGFHDNQSGPAIFSNRSLYINDAREVVFFTSGAYGSHGLRSKPISKNTWHHVVGTVGPNGKALYVDGVLVGTHGGIVAEETNPGHWRIGAGPVSKRYGSVSNPNFLGTIDRVSTYDMALTASQIKRHFEAVKNSAPTADFGVVCEGLICQFRNFSTDPDANITSYSWTFGNGQTATHRSPKITFASPAAYEVTLKVADGMGLSATRKMTVQVGP